MIEITRSGWIVVVLAALCSLSACGAQITATIRVDHPTPKVSPANVVVWLTPVDVAEPRPVPRLNVRLVQKDKQFSPHLLVVPTGTSVDFPNMDPFFHNVFSLFNGKRFDLGLYEAGSRRSVTFDREGVSYIFCNIHPAMGAVVVSLNSPWFAVSDASGAVTIRDVPPGRYRLQTWAEQLALSSTNRSSEIIEISSESYDLGSLQFHTINGTATHHKNKFGNEYPPEAHSPY